jgi:outer membrane protein W
MIRGAICLLLAVSVTPAIAQAQKSGSRVWVAMSYVSPLSESDQNVGGVTEAVKASDEMGWQLGAEFRSGMLGLAVDYMKSKHDLSASAAGLLGNTEFSPISGSLLWHLPGGQLDFYGGPTASWVNWSDLELSTGGSLKLDGTFAYGLTVGAELPLSTGLAVGGSLRWLNLDAKASDTDETVSVDPLISNLSLSFRF